MKHYLKMAGLLMLTLALTGFWGSAGTPRSPNENGEVAIWLETSLNRIFPRSPVGIRQPLSLLAARNSRISFQVGYQNQTTGMKHVTCALDGAELFSPRIRYVGLVPMHHFTPHTPKEELDGFDYLPGLVPDPLYPLTTVESAPFESRSFWVTLDIPATVSPGIHEFQVSLSYNNGKVVEKIPVRVEVSQLVVKPRENFDVIHWWRGEATWDFYQTEMFDERWWALTQNQVENMLDHGSNVIYVPIFFNRRETFKRPCQLLIVDEPEPGKYAFDWTRVERFVKMAKAVGVRKFEWSHLWIYWGVENPIRVYTKKGDHYEMLWHPNISGSGDVYVNFLKQFLPEFHQFLVREEILKDSYFHLSDELGVVTGTSGPEDHINNYKVAREILRKYAPWMKVMDALSDIRYGRQNLTDIPIPLVSEAQAYIDENIPHWVYYCCVPHGKWINRFMDTPLAKIRMSGWLFYKLKADGFLHWGYNWWHKIGPEEIIDPFTETAGAAYPGGPYGDPFVVYPGPDGVLDGIRWEVFAESLQDYAILQTAGISPDDPPLDPIAGYGDFPKQEAWIRQTLETVLKNTNQSAY